MLSQVEGHEKVKSFHRLKSQVIVRDDGSGGRPNIY